MIGRMLCRLGFHDWKYWEPGHVYGGGFFAGMHQCRRCRIKVSHVWTDRHWWCAHKHSEPRA